MNVPETDRFLRSYAKSILQHIVQNDKILNRDFGGANGVYADGTVLKVAGINIVKSNSATTAFTDQSLIAQQVRTTLNVDASTTVATVFHKSAIGTVMLGFPTRNDL